VRDIFPSFARPWAFPFALQKYCSGKQFHSIPLPVSSKKGVEKLRTWWHNKSDLVDATKQVPLTLTYLQTGFPSKTIYEQLQLIEVTCLLYINPVHSLIQSPLLNRKGKQILNSRRLKLWCRNEFFFFLVPAWNGDMLGRWNVGGINLCLLLTRSCLHLYL
jgi:hypothetical protein